MSPDRTSCMNCPAGTYTDQTKAVVCNFCPRATYSSEEGSTFCNRCLVSYHIGQSTTAREGTTSESLCLAPLWNFVLLEYVVYTILGRVILHVLRGHRDQQRARASLEEERTAPLTKDLEPEYEGALDQKDRRRKSAALYVAKSESENAETDASVPMSEPQVLADASTPASSSNFVSDLLLRYPALIGVKVFVGRMLMVMDIGSDVTLILSLFANDAGRSFC